MFSLMLAILIANTLNYIVSPVQHADLSFEAASEFAAHWIALLFREDNICDPNISFYMSYLN